MPFFVPDILPKPALLFVLALFSASFVQADICQLPLAQRSILNKVMVERVIDGDSLLLSSGQQLRLVGVNAPEMYHRQTKLAEPLAAEAKQAVHNWLAEQAFSVYVQSAEQGLDRYQRQLAYVFDAKGRELGAYLLAQGLGFLVAIPPNLRWLNCHIAQQNMARKSGLGVWKEPYFNALKLASAAGVPANSLSEAQLGFRRISAVVQSVNINGGGAWLRLSGQLTARIKPAHLSSFDMSVLKYSEGQLFEFSGWVSSRKLTPAQKQRGFSPFILHLTHPVHMQSR